MYRQVSGFVGKCYEVRVGEVTGGSALALGTCHSPKIVLYWLQEVFMKKRMKNINLTEGLAKRLEKYARSVGLSESDIVRRALEQYLRGCEDGEK